MQQNYLFLIGTNIQKNNLNPHLVTKNNLKKLGFSKNDGIITKHYLLKKWFLEKYIFPRKIEKTIKTIY